MNTMAVSAGLRPVTSITLPSRLLAEISINAAVAASADKTWVALVASKRWTKAWAGDRATVLALKKSKKDTAYKTLKEELLVVAAASLLV